MMKKLLAGLLPFALLLILSNTVFATSALPGSNSSAYNAQYVCASRNCGALWLTNNADVAIDRITIPSDYSSSTIGVKLYGAVYSHSDNSTDYKYGNNVHILTEERNKYSGMTPSSDFSSITYTPITFNGSYTLAKIYRGRGTGSAGTWSTGWDSGGADATLNIDSFKSSATNYGNGLYERIVHVWRCYGDSYTYEPSSCYSDEMKIILQDEGETGANTDYASRSAVKIKDDAEQVSDWRGSTTATAETEDASVDVTFRHELKRTGDTSFTATASWRVYQGDVGNIIDSGSWSGTSTTGAQVNSNTVTVNLTAGETKTVCQTINHDRNIKVEITPAGVVTEKSRSAYSGSSTACATITRNTPPPTPGENSYSGKTTVTLNGTPADDGWDTTSSSVEKNVNDGTLNIEFGHYLKLNDSTLEEYASSVHTNWNTYTDNDLVGGVATNQAWYGTSATGVLINNPKAPVVLNLGHIFSVCQELYFDKTVEYEVDADGNVTETSRSNQDGHAKACALARYPYNFETTATAHISATDIVYAGETVSSSFIIGSTTRVNTAVSDTAYATAMPAGTKVSYAQFTIPATNDMISDDLLSGSTNVLSSDSELCDYVESKGFNNCVETSAEGSSLNTNVSRYVPDVEPGTKYCVISGISHADSHNLPGETLDETTGLNSYALSDSKSDPTTSPYWRISPASCRTIAKKPSTQVWGGSVYSNGDINATTSSKTPNATLSTAPASSATKLFGSWTEYAVVNGGNSAKTVGFASAAGLGFSSSRGPVSTFCTLTHLSVANDSCTGITGYSGMSGVNLDDSIITRLKNRLTINNHSDETDTRPADSDLSAVSYYTLPSGAQYVYVNGNAKIDSVLNTPSTAGSGVTRIIHVNGTLAINANVCSGTGDCNSSPTELKLSTRNSQSLSTLASIPQTIIFADDIKIAASVTQVDAWLVATGNVNTCDVANLSASACSRMLIINGPVIADSITLNRSGGSWTGNNSGVNLYSDDIGSTALGGIAPGEIINFRADSYFWILRQITSSAEPGTAYIRELAPRY